MRERLRNYTDAFELTYPLTDREQSVILSGGIRYHKVSETLTYEYGFDMFERPVVRKVELGRDTWHTTDEKLKRFSEI